MKLLSYLRVYATRLYRWWADTKRDPNNAMHVPKNEDARV
jgi:hypothetical protein